METAQHNRRLLFTLLAAALFLLGADGTGRDPEERQALLDRMHVLQDRVATLKREQDFLVFQKTMYSSDSKYLLINGKKKTAQLKYKSRVLNDFPFKTSNDFPGKALAPGAATLTQKIEGKKARHTLVFGTAFVVKWKLSEAPRKTATLPFIMLTKKEFLSIYYSVDPGTKVYLVE